ncbi:MAG: efflux RND transporter periplasmic adaptor subunit [Fibrobacteraceae bacterium]|nr:efflux RND transporter periplasmic adaptor subunit [Fibrobacteraceae bacterium]
MKTTITGQIITLAAISLLLAACGGKKEAAKAAPTMEEIQSAKGKPAKIITAGETSIADIREFSGSIEGIQQTNAIAKLSDPIAKINVQVGTNVQKDQVLAEFVFTGDNSSFQQAEEQVKLLELSTDRVRKAFEKGGVSQQDLDQAETQLKISKMQLEAARRATLVLAPAAGVITDVRFEAGEVPGVGTTMFTIARLDQVILKLSITSQDIGLFKKGASAEVALNGETLKGKVTMIPLAADPTTRFFPVEITFNNKGKKLLPGMFVTAKIHAGTAKGISVPNDAITYKDGINMVWIVDAEGKAKRKLVTLGIVSDKTTQILSGIELGDKVIVEGSSKLNDGDKVLVLN